DRGSATSGVPTGVGGGGGGRSEATERSGAGSSTGGRATTAASGAVVSGAGAGIRPATNFGTSFSTIRTSRLSSKRTASAKPATINWQKAINPSAQQASGNTGNGAPSKRRGGVSAMVRRTLASCPEGVNPAVAAENRAPRTAAAW